MFAEISRSDRAHSDLVIWTEGAQIEGQTRILTAHKKLAVTKLFLLRSSKRGTLRAHGCIAKD